MGEYFRKKFGNSFKKTHGKRKKMKFCREDIVTEIQLKVSAFQEVNLRICVEDCTPKHWHARVVCLCYAITFRKQLTEKHQRQYNVSSECANVPSKQYTPMHKFSWIFFKTSCITWRGELEALLSPLLGNLHSDKQPGWKEMRAEKRLVCSSWPWWQNLPFL